MSMSVDDRVDVFYSRRPVWFTIYISKAAL